MSAASALFWRLKEHDPLRHLHRARRAALITRIRVAAAWHRSRVELDIAPDLKLGRAVRVDIAPNTTNVVRIGPRCAIRDAVALQLKGGSIVLGPECELRRNTILNVSGHLELMHHNILSYGVVVHCAEKVVLERFASVAELSTIADSTHYWTTPDDFFYDNVRTAPIHIGANTWLCPRSAITSGVTVGSHCLIGSGSVVTSDVPDGHLASGVPATNLRPLDHPWTRT